MSVPDGHEILIVEDNPADVDLLRRAIEEADVPVTLHVATTGAEAIERLRGDGGPGGSGSVDLVVLDLDLPGMSGFDVLDALKTLEPVETTPVLVLTTSDDRTAIERAYALGANAFLVKRDDFGDALALLRAIDAFWLTTAELPE